eukprot:s4452_g2.t1
MDAGIRNIMEDMDACTTTPHSPTGDRISRLLEQMRTCVLVHHQLSCLLIHASALDAGAVIPKLAARARAVHYVNFWLRS